MCSFHLRSHLNNTKEITLKNETMFYVEHFKKRQLWGRKLRKSWKRECEEGNGEEGKASVITQDGRDLPRAQEKGYT